MSTRSIPRVFAVLPHVIPSTTLGVIKPMQYLHMHKQIIAHFGLEAFPSLDQVANADVLIMSRNTDPAQNRAWQYACQLGKPIIYELDDNLFDLPADSAVGAYHRDPERMNQLAAYIRSANLVRVYSTTLQRRLAELNSNIVQVEGLVDWKLVPPRLPHHRSPEQVWIVYATSRLVDELAEIFIDATTRLLDEYDDRIKLFLWGCRPPRLTGYRNVQFLNYVADYDRFFRKFAAAGFDIGLAPLPADVFHLSKSNNKFREYAAAGIAGIYSNVLVYSECVQNNVTGVLVENRSDAWYDALIRLIEAADWRRRIQMQAQVYARAHYDLEKFSGDWLSHINSVLAQPVRRGAVTSIQSVPATSPAGWGMRRLMQLAIRFVQRLGTNGLGTAVEMARWRLNDLSILWWNRLHG